MRAVNLSILATAFSSHAKEESNYKRLQRFLREFEMPYAELALFIVKLLGVPGPYTLALDRTNWKSGRCPQHPDAFDRLSRRRDSSCLDRFVQSWQFRHQRTDDGDRNFP